MDATRLVILSACLLVPATQGGNVLVKPWGGGARSSHLFIMEKICRILASDGHNVTFLLGSEERQMALRQGFLSLLHYNTLTFNTTGSVTESDRKDMRQYLQRFGKSFSIFSFLNSVSEKRYCELIVSEPNLLETIKHGGYDYVIVDHVDACGRLLANYLKKPFAIVLSFPSNTVIYGEGASPLVLSFTPTHGIYSTLQFSHKMALVERAQNVLNYAADKLLVYLTLERTMNSFGWKHALLQVRITLA